ncbi:MAG: glucose-1-phosphate adenylyltransferase [Pirellulaceae bacterium]|nr:glucose-1-phosphate adenylyltransferase [Pirellulaceae bacterium]
MNDTLAVILAGGKGTRLEPLTRDRAKPAVPFGGIYRIIDFVLSNCLNSGMRKLLVLTQYKTTSLDRHLDLAWKGYFCRELNEFIDIIPPQQRIDEQWYQGTADAVYQNIYEIEKERPKYIVVLAGDHIYKMNYRRMVEYHIAEGADLTVGALRVDLDSATQFGVMQIDSDQRVIGFQEKPANPRPLPDDPTHCFASMGIYVFSTRFLLEQLCRDANEPTSSHDFGKNIIPSIIGDHRVVAFPFRDENGKQDAYWRDVGTLDAYYEANMDLIGVNPQLNLYDEVWPIRTFQLNQPPPKFVFGSRNDGDRCGQALDSVVCAGTVISGGRVERSVVGPMVRINSYSHISDSILFEGVEVGRHCRIRRAIIDKGVRIPPGFEIGYDLEKDRQRGFTISDNGIVTIPKTDSIASIFGQQSNESMRVDAPSTSESAPRPNRASYKPEAMDRKLA